MGKSLFMVYVHTQGKTNYEFVRSFDNEDAAMEFVRSLRDKRDNCQTLSDSMQLHMKNLDWIIKEVE